MSILNVNKINPVGGGSTITIAGIASVTNNLTATNISAGSSVTANSFHGDEIKLGDNKKILLGEGNDIEIYHTGAVDLIESKSLYLIQESQNIILRNLDGDEAYAKFFGNGAVELYHDGTKQVETSANGLKFPNGKGIDFSSTPNSSGTTDNELFDDYEEGLFTPTVAGSSGSATVTYQGSDNRRGRYVKIGKMVHVNCLVGWNDVSNGFTGNIQVGGLPFAHENVEHADPNDYTQSVGSVYYQNLTLPYGNDGHCVVYIWGGYSTYVLVMQTRSNSGLSFVDINSGNNSSSSAIKYIQFSLTYPAA